MQKNKNVRITQVKPDVEWGLYMWRLPSGKLFQDGDGNYLNIPSRKGDIQKMQELTKAAVYYGQPEGSLHFEPGVQRATEEEYREQVDRLESGLIPSLNDFGAINDARRGIAQNGEQDG